MRSTILAWAVLPLLLSCVNGAKEHVSDQSPSRTSAPITLDGSSTVHPIFQALLADFQAEHRTAVHEAFSGTGGGFRKFCQGGLTINGASRPIMQSEVETCRHAGVRYIELPIAFDGIVVAVHPDNTWATSITASELKRLWEPEAENKITRWSQLRSEWPAVEIHLYGAGTDSGTYDYFTAAIVGTEHSSRSDFTGSEDDDVLVNEIAKDPRGLGFFGIAYYEKNKAKIKALAVDDEKVENGPGPVMPSPESVSSGTYQPLTRPMFMYVNRAAADRAEVSDFVRFILRRASSAVEHAGSVALPANAYDLVLYRFENRIQGSLFHGRGSTIGVKASDLTATK